MEKNPKSSIQVIKNISWWTLFFIFISLLNIFGMINFTSNGFKQIMSPSHMFLPILAISYLCFWGISINLLVNHTKDLNTLIRRFVGFIIHIPFMMYSLYFLVSKIKLHYFT